LLCVPSGSGVLVLCFVSSTESHQDRQRKPSRRAHILLAYLPTTRLEHITNKASRRRAISNLFHACMKRVLNPLRQAGERGM
ncbi:hypothetical protein BJ138DRAFT_1199065, partial [Hygrophoropsis aurantiaca]